MARSVGSSEITLVAPLPQRLHQAGARSPASLVISSVWKPYMKHNCKLDVLGTGFEIAAGYWIWHGGYLIFKPRLSSKVYSDKTHYEGGSYTFSEV